VSLKALAQEMTGLHSVVVLTGAGISAESGIATFRGAGGYWQRFKAEELASPQGFARDPALVWRWYDERRRQILTAQPNPGHLALVELERLFPDFSLITQNVDGLHQAAGSRKVIEIHGSIWRVRCTKSDQEWEQREVFETFPILCQCGALLRPAVLWFGEAYDSWKVQQALHAISQAEQILVVGTSGLVSVVSGLLSQAPETTPIAEFNLAPTELSQISHQLITGPAGETLPQLVRYLLQ